MKQYIGLPLLCSILLTVTVSFYVISGTGATCFILAGFGHSGPELLIEGGFPSRLCGFPFYSVVITYSKVKVLWFESVANFMIWACAVATLLILRKRVARDRDT